MGFLRSTLGRHLLYTVVAAVLLWLLTLVFSDYNNFQLATLGSYAIAIAGLSLLTGLNGQISLGHGAFMMVGAYTTALLGKHSHLPLAVVLILSAVAAAAAGLITGIGAARLRGPYLAGVTLALAVGLPELTIKYASALGGEQGVAVNPPVPPGFISQTSANRYLAWIVIICALVTFLVLSNLIRSRFGRDFRAVRDDEIAASLSGINVARNQVLAFVVSAACAGLGGAVYALAIGIVNPAGFSLVLSIALLTGAVIGGLGSLAGAVWGGLLLVYLPRVSDSLSSHLSLSKAVSSNLSLAIYGVVLIAVMLSFPGGVQAGLRLATGAVRRRFGGSRRPRGA
ncbi:MAG TPA: branched-chain amino acid ABC transporter permease [Acidimicrobiales bacterium]|nr:branched-chain amino acid ABC transporter permease [Acidimicrobiales bacterium]